MSWHHLPKMFAGIKTSFVIPLTITCQQSCGVKPPSFNIIAGEEATPNEWPWQLSFQDNNNGSHFCGATLIDAEWALTAAHCILGKSPSRVQVIAGEHSQSSNSGNEQTLQIDALYAHPNYSLPRYDCALIHLSTPAVFNDYVSPGCLPSLSDDYSNDDYECWISGWGQTSVKVPDVLQEVQIDVWSMQECIEYEDHESIVCVIGLEGEPASACYGDSGGPISCNRGNGQWDVVGLSSFVVGACPTTSPSRYSRVTASADWITEMTGLEFPA